MLMNDHIMEKYAAAPRDPGVYLMKDDQDTIIYVGKAMNLKKRLASYFVRETGHDMKTGVLLKKIADFDIIVTSTEHEALILESNLIKKHKPRYNVILKDGKNYPCLRIDVTQDYPTLEVVRKIANDKALYFGPYSSAASVRSTLKQVNRIFRLRKCKPRQFASRSRPCLNCQINACLGPCCLDVPKDEYDAVIRDVVLFLRGKAPELIRKLRQEMMAEAGAERFEKAAHIRDTITAIEKTLERQVVVAADMQDRDVIACAGGQDRAVVTIQFVRSGYLVGSRNYLFDMTYNDIPEILEAFVHQYYERHRFVPASVLLSQPVESLATLEQELVTKRGKKMTLSVPVRGEKRRLMEMALLNAQNELEQSLSKAADIRNTLLMIQKRLNMTTYPTRMECFDNSNLAGTDPVSSMVVFTLGVPDRASYRKFIIKTVDQHDDYAYMTEVLRRRFLSTDKDLVLPDLLVVDGGRGQLSMAMNVLAELGLENRFQVAGLAKRDKDRGEEDDKIYLPNRSNPVNMNQAKKALFMLQRLRDEAHRFAVTFQRKRRAKRSSASILDTIPGVGPKRKQLLMETFQGITALRRATVDEIAALPGMSRAVAEAVIAGIDATS